MLSDLKVPVIKKKKGNENNILFLMHTSGNW